MEASSPLGFIEQILLVIIHADAIRWHRGGKSQHGHQTSFRYRRTNCSAQY